MSLWLPAEPLVLASQSKVRRAVLDAAGIPVEVRPARIDERGVEARAGVADPGEAAVLLAQAKARAVGDGIPDRLVLGADQTLARDGRRFTKPADVEQARAQLCALAGGVHALHSGIALAYRGEIVFRHVEVARLTMRALTDDFLDRYLATAGASVADSVGGYQLERLGIHLFERVEGDHFTILGLPLLPLLRFLRARGFVAG